MASLTLIFTRSGELRTHEAVRQSANWPGENKCQRSHAHGLLSYGTNHGPFARYVKLRVAHAPGLPGTFSTSPWISDPAMHHGMCVTHVPSCKPRSLTSGFLWSLWRGKRSRHSQRMRDAKFYVSGKRLIATLAWWKCEGSKIGVLVIVTTQHKPLESAISNLSYGNPHVTVEYNDRVLYWGSSAKIRLR